MSAGREKSWYATNNIAGRLIGGIACACLLFGLSGCKSGTSAWSPSWSAFGGSNASEAAKLTAAPPFDGKSAKGGSIEKPSASASPYPTTTTPSGYVVNTPKNTSSLDADPSRGSLPSSPKVAFQAPVTYGTTPPPSAQPSVEAAMTAGTTRSPGAPQIGPYASLPAGNSGIGDGSRASSVGTTSAPAGSAFPATAGYEPTRLADARSAASYSQPQAATDGSLASGLSSSGVADSRYASASSRFGGGPPLAALAPQAPASFPTAPPAEQPTTAVSAALVPPAAGLPQNFVPPPAAPSAPATTLPILPGSLPAPPVRRPDPGYRPGGTSSYRSSRSILVDDPPSAPSAVRTAAYEVPAENPPSD